MLPTPVDDQGALVIVYNYNVLLKLFFGQLQVGSMLLILETKKTDSGNIGGASIKINKIIFILSRSCPGSSARKSTVLV